MSQTAMIIPLMRLLDSPNCSGNNEHSAAVLAQHLQNPSPAVVGGLRRLRDNFGAVTNRRGQWRLTFSPQWLDAAALSQALQAQHANLQVYINDETIGTNDWAKTFHAQRNNQSQSASQHISQPKSAADIFIAEHQTRGRGRLGREWLAMPGGSIMMSLSAPAPPMLAGLSLAVGAALWRVLSASQNFPKSLNNATSIKSIKSIKSPKSPQPLFIKWPNDLLDATGRKVGGILVEKSNERIIIGAGINLVMNKTLQSHLSKPAAALNFAEGRNACAVKIGGALLQAVTEFAAHGLSTFMEDIKRAHYVQTGQPISFTAASGEIMRGCFSGFDEDGALLISRNRGGNVQRFVSGEIGNVAGN